MAEERLPEPVIPEQWRERPDLLPALQVWVEGARRALERRRREEAGRPSEDPEL